MSENEMKASEQREHGHCHEGHGRHRGRRRRWAAMMAWRMMSRRRARWGGGPWQASADFLPERENPVRRDPRQVTWI
jgi:hypothetical protein